MVEGTPLLRAHLGKTRIQGSNPCVSASNDIQARDSVGFFVFTAFVTINSTINYQPGWRLPPSHFFGRQIGFAGECIILTMARQHCLCSGF